MKSHFSSQYLNMKAIYQKQLVLTNKHNVTLNKRFVKDQDFCVYWFHGSVFVAVFSIKFRHHLENTQKTKSINCNLFPSLSCEIIRSTDWLCHLSPPPCNLLRERANICQLIVQKAHTDRCLINTLQHRD